MTDATKPAGSPSVYHPAAQPIKQSKNAPAIPSSVVTMHPPGSLPGIKQLGDNSHQQPDNESPKYGHKLRPFFARVTYGPHSGARNQGWP